MNLLNSFLNSSKHQIIITRPISEKKNLTTNLKVESDKRISPYKQSEKKIGINNSHIQKQLSTGKAKQDYLKSEYIRKILYQNKFLSDDLKRLKQIEMLYLKQKQLSQYWKKVSNNLKDKYQKKKQTNKNKNETDYKLLDDFSSIIRPQQLCIKQTNINKQKYRFESKPSLQDSLKKIPLQNQNEKSTILKITQNSNYDKSNHQSFNQIRNNQSQVQSMDNKCLSNESIQQQQIMKKNNNKFKKILQELENQKKIRCSLQIENRKLKQRIEVLQKNNTTLNNSDNLIKINKSRSIQTQNQQLRKKVEKLTGNLQKQKQTVQKIRGLLNYGQISTPQFKYK